ncbi:MAG: DUF29 domain-containing protein [Limnothrix sp. RL_2_0]|nr:DUF29 domain-containing protein [Limnothrix sp. RL_2_0]
MESSLLYEQDILLWVEDTVAKLKARDFENIDIENLIEEVESLGISQKKELISRLIVILEHLLKRLYVDSSYDFHGWERTVRTQRNNLQVLIDQVPSLKRLWDTSFDKAWNIALKTVCEDYPNVDFPTEWSYSREIEAMLNERFWLNSEG